MKNRQKKVRFGPLETAQIAFNTDEKCQNALFLVRAAKSINVCPICGADLFKSFRPVQNRRSYQCIKCTKQVYLTAGTVLENTKLPLRTIFRIIIDMLIDGISANKISHLYQIRYPTAHSLLRKIRLWMHAADNVGKFKGIVECDEVALPTGSKGLFREFDGKGRRGFMSLSITPFFAMMERETGRVKMFKIDERDEDTLLPIIMENVEPGSTICTDDWKAYSKLESLGFKHLVVNHSKHQYSVGNATTNRVEGFFGHVKPNLLSTHRHITDFYSEDYLYEQCFRYNNRNLSLEQRLDKLLNALPPLC